MKILVAEDEIQMNRVLTTALTHEGYDVDSVYDGQAAIDMATENAYDVIGHGHYDACQIWHRSCARNSSNRQPVTHYYVDCHG